LENATIQIYCVIQIYTHSQGKECSQRWNLIRLQQHLAPAPHHLQIPRPTPRLDSTLLRGHTRHHESGSTPLYQHATVAPPNSHQPNTEVSELTYTSSFPSKPPLMLSTIDKNKGISKYLQSTQCQQQSSNKHTSSPSHIPFQLGHNTLDTTSWPTAKGMAPCHPTHKQRKKT
jgi:hypothetical protein